MPAAGRLARDELPARLAMAVTPQHLLAVGGIAVVALAGGYGIAQLTGDDSPPPAKRSAAEASLPSLGEPAVARVVVLGNAAALPAPRATRTRRQRPQSGGGGSGGGASPEATAAPPSAEPTAQPPSTPPSTPPSAPEPTTAPAPERTPVVGGGTGGEEP